MACSPVLRAVVRECGHAFTSATSEELCSLDAASDDIIPKSVLEAVPAVLGRLAEAGSDIHAFVRAMDELEGFAFVSRASPRHRLIVEQLAVFRARFDCIDCDPVEYLLVRLAVARMMNGSERYEDAKRLSGFLIDEASRMLDCDELTRALRDRVDWVVFQLEECVECAVKRKVYLC